MVRSNIELNQKALGGFCRRHHISKLSLFGSVLTDRFGPDSDVDVLVEFQPGRTPTLIGMAALELELSELLGRTADLRTEAELSRYFRDEVVRGAELQYAQG